MYINRRELKANAKAVLKKTYVVALIMSVILCIAGASTYKSSSSRYSINKNDITAISLPFDGSGFSPTHYTVNDFLSSVGYVNPFISNIVGNISFFAIGLAIVGIILVTVILSSVFRIAIGFHLEVGARGYFTETAEGKPSGFASLKRGFTNGAYVKVLVTMLMRSLLIFLWSLLFVIPGIIKTFEYTFVPYILADNPELDWKRALDISKQMTYGYKMQMFVLQLSFIGWYILGALLFGIGQALVWPYVNATFAQLYLQLRNNAVNAGIVSAAELNLVPTVEVLAD